jgi:hypothetical protein
VPSTLATINNTKKTAAFLMLAAVKALLFGSRHAVIVLGSDELLSTILFFTM